MPIRAGTISTGAAGYTGSRSCAGARPQQGSGLRSSSANDATSELGFGHLAAVDWMTHFDRLIRVASRLGKGLAGSAKADRIIHDALGRAGPVLPYTTDEGTARSLLPPDFEWLAITYAAGCIYAPCRRAGLDGELPHPHYGQWGQTLPLSLCGAAMRTWAMLAKG
jgi:hypothetical protein